MSKSLKDKLAEQLAKNMAAHEAGGQESNFDAGKEHKKVQLELIDPNPYQPRIVFDPVEIEELAESIQTVGLLQPITVRPLNNRFQIVAGERRFRAHQFLNKRSIEAIVMSVSDEDMATQALAENIAREDLSDYEIAQAIKAIQFQFPSKKKLAESLGIIREDIYTFFAFDALPTFVIERLATNPRLVSRTLAKELKSVISKEGNSDAVQEAVRRGIELLEAGQIAAGAVIDFVRRSIHSRVRAANTLEPYHLVRSGKRVGTISHDSRNVVVKIKRAALNDEQEQRLIAFMDALATEAV